MNHNQYFNNLKSFKHFVNSNNNQSSFINVMSINIRSISSIQKFNKFKSLVSYLPRLPTIIAVQETWFESKLAQIYNIAGYKAVHCCRSDNYGGTTVFISENLEYEIDSCESSNFVDFIALTLKNSKFNGKSLKFCSFYRSQKCDTTSFFSFLENLLIKYGRNPCVLVGDSNIDSLNNSSSEELVNLLANYDFKNCHTLITRPDSGTSIDHIYSNIYDSFNIQSVECNLSDHNLIFCEIEIQTQTQDFIAYTRSYCDYDRVKEYIQNQLPSLCVTGDPSIDTSLLISCVVNAIDDCSVEKQHRSIIRDAITPWINANLQKLMTYKKKLLKQRRSRPDNEDLKRRLKGISKVIKKASRESMNNYYKDNLSEIQNDPKKSWKFLNESLGRQHKRSISIKDANGEIIVNDFQKAETLNNYFLQSIQDLRSQIDQVPTDFCNSLRTLTQHGTTFHLSYTSYDEVHNVIKKLTPNKSCGHDNISPKVLLKCGNILTPYLVNVFNNMIDRSIYPDILKLHKVVPIPKERNASGVEMFRPIAVLSIIDNVFEKILHEQVSKYLLNNNLLNDYQYGFRKGCGTEEAVLNVINFICNGLDKGNCGVAGIFYDFSKAFDLIDHKILIEKLTYYGICGTELSLFKSYLTNRQQYVQINSQKSSLRSVQCGVPQGSVLGPLLFMIYLNDITKLGLFGKLFIYADDISLFYPYKHETVVKAYMEHDAAIIFEFARINKLILNANKTQLIRFKPYSSNNIYFSVFVDGREIVDATSVKYLGIYLQNNLSWNQHIQSLKSKTSQAIGFLYKFKNKFDHDTKFLIYNALVQSHLNYLAVLYGWKKSTELKSLQRVQNRALKAVANLPITHPTISLFNDVFKSVLPIYGIYKMQLLLYVFKSTNSIGHHTIKFSRNQNTHNTRNNSNLMVARCRLETTKQKIEYMGGHQFNDLPQYLKCLNRISNFKSSLKKYLLENVEELLM